MGDSHRRRERPWMGIEFGIILLPFFLILFEDFDGCEILWNCHRKSLIVGVCYQNIHDYRHVRTVDHRPLEKA